MNKLTLIFAAAATLFAGGASQSFTGTITDSMCVGNHAAMKMGTDAKCVVACVKASRNVKYVLYDGKNVYKLSDQQTPERFAAQKVKVTGELQAGTIQVTEIEGAK
jgi:hypothetical protein